MKRRNGWKAVGLFALLTVLFVAGAGGLWLQRVLQDPNSGKLTAVSESDDSVLETRTIVFNSGRIKTIRRTASASISAQIEKELMAEGFGPLIPLFEQAGRKDWMLSRQAGIAGPQTQIYGRVRCDPHAIYKVARNLAGAVKSEFVKENGFTLSAESKSSGRVFSLSLFDRNNRECSLSFVLMPKPGTAAIRAEDLKPFSESSQTK